jgi:hypothetical protein
MFWIVGKRRPARQMIQHGRRGFYMPAAPGRTRSKKRRSTTRARSSQEAPAQAAVPSASLSQRWHDLARRRLLYFVEFYRSGRWTLYYLSSEQFAVQMVQAIETEKIWAALAGVSPASDDDLRSAA